ncbi:MAG TPA: hypothetical protein VGI70_09515 [Polyangiales bacterium]|jgi:hypothetical protein
MRTIGLALALLTASATAHAQLLRVYEYEQPAQGTPEFSLWNSWVPKSGRQYSFLGKERERDGLWMHALEVEYGVTPNLAFGAYVDAERPEAARFAYTQARLLFRYAFLRKHDLPIDVGIYVEYYLPRPEYGPEHVELRLILERDFADFSLRVNPMLDKVTSGDSISSVEFEYAAGIYYRRLLCFQPGIEAFGSTGELQSPERARHQQHQLFGVIDLRFFGGALRWHLGAGYGYSRGADDLTIKSILSYEPAPSFALVR